MYVTRSAGAAATVARLVGKGDLRSANVACHQAFVIAAVVGIAGALAGLTALPGLLAALGLDGLAGEYAGDFLRVTLLLLPVQFPRSTAMTSLAAAGDTRTALWIGAVATLANLPLAWLGFRGAGAGRDSASRASPGALEPARRLVCSSRSPCWPGAGRACGCRRPASGPRRLRGLLRVRGTCPGGGGETRLLLVIKLMGFFLVRLPLTAWLTWDAVPLPWAGAPGTATSISGLRLGLWGCWLAMQADLWARGAAYVAAFAQRWSAEGMACREEVADRLRSRRWSSVDQNHTARRSSDRPGGTPR